MARYFEWTNTARASTVNALGKNSWYGEIMDLRRDLRDAFGGVAGDIDTGMGGSVRIVRFNPDSASIVKLVTPKHDTEIGMAKMVDRLGEVYDYRGLVGMAWVELGRWLRKKWSNPWQSSKAMFCSELVAQVLVDSNYPMAQQFDPASTDPEQLLEFFLKEEGK
jgi:hypothetical protein